MEAEDRDLEKLRRLQARKAEIEAELKKREVIIREKARQRRSRRLLSIGRLAEAAGLADEDPAFLLGGLLELAVLRSDKQAYQRLSKKGARALSK